MNRCYRTGSVLAIIFLLAGMTGLMGQSVVGTAHDLSASGNLGNYVCEYCHTPHAAVPQTALWSRDLPGTVYIMYDQAVSSTSNIPDGTGRQPDGSSILCLSCHDGTIASGSPDREIPDGSSAILGSDLSDDHPVSFVYDASFAASDGELHTTPLYPASLDANSKLQCTSCHSPHRDIHHSFLVSSAEYSELCMNCHDRDHWGSTSHNISNASWNSSGVDPWAHMKYPYNTVAQNACSNCHGMHAAGGSARLMKKSPEEQNCLDCHNGNVAAANKNIETQLNKTYGHDVTAYDQLHEPDEPALLPSSQMHVECVDCHNPHAARNNPTDPPQAMGAIEGVMGVDQSGLSLLSVQYEYELCFRCHSDYAPTSSLISRSIEQSNTRLEFSPSAISFHPVLTEGVNPDVQSLIAPLTENSLIYCTDCHASDGATSPAGPHGSIYPQILKYQYETADYTAESAQAYELCYACHDRTVFMTNSGDNVQTLIHFTHIVTASIPCSGCHDPHGISDTQGNSSANSHLINFDLSIASAVQGNLYFQDNGYRTGSCTLRCHNRGHNNRSY